MRSEIFNFFLLLLVDFFNVLTLHFDSLLQVLNLLPQLRFFYLKFHSLIPEHFLCLRLITGNPLNLFISILQQLFILNFHFLQSYLQGIRVFQIFIQLYHLFVLHLQSLLTLFKEVILVLKVFIIICNDVGFIFGTGELSLQ